MSGNLKQRLAAGEMLVGTFVKTPSPIVVEVLGLSALDCLCLDAEHAPFDRPAIDACIMAARAAGMDVLVRVPSAAPEHILNALDCGATGVVIPHVRSAEEACTAVRLSHYGAGGRGYAGSARAAAYTTKPMAAHLADSAARTTVVLQIEDPEAIDAIEEIAAVEGVDALFVGRVDLTVAYGAASQDDPQVIAAVEKVCAAGRRHGRRTGMFLARLDDVPTWIDKGATLFLLGSDHSFMLAGAAALVAQVKR
ncbi:HpcH/HpaI aldolase family protein [Edaphosphingomonas haloaromaticamans]|uniref:5-keto-4-deoxy-D-glucarate aldolase n=1 Tax=Edaphosphingomonas haloaromaticamans TaxID=653954 RepID=A0A1S1HEC7_9SPHN|nr:aldolase/citrate lyase family protein [Sphingomonas haloaromaticamans]OHT20609.1 5-keto-4-deoxy-D-glucarate aldolase [Sphingomonas haloaromaticamans]